METTRPTCVYCGGAINVHERVVVVEHDGERETSLGREPDLERRGGALMIHSRCAPPGWRDGDV